MYMHWGNSASPTQPPTESSHAAQVLCPWNKWWCFTARVHHDVLFQWYRQQKYSRIWHKSLQGRWWSKRSFGACSSEWYHFISDHYCPVTVGSLLHASHTSLVQRARHWSPSTIKVPPHTSKREGVELARLTCLVARAATESGRQLAIEYLFPQRHYSGEETDENICEHTSFMSLVNNNDWVSAEEEILGNERGEEREIGKRVYDTHVCVCVWGGGGGANLYIKQAFLHM